MPEVYLAILLGTMSTLHCFGMCGGIIGALTASLKSDIQHNRKQLFVYVLAYNLGRISSYTLAGLIVGVLGSNAVYLFSEEFGHWILKLLSASIMIAIGFYLAGWFPQLQTIERISRPLWRKLEPYAKRLLPVSNIKQAFLFGTLWGWLPCGLVYAVLGWAMVSGGPIEGMEVMLFFGLGTLPFALASGVFASWVIELSQIPYVRKGAGVIVIVAAVLTIYTSLLHLH